MISEIANAIWKLEGLPCIQKSVLTGLAFCCSRTDGTDIYPTLDLLAARIGLNEKTIRRALKVLEKEGYIKADGLKGHIKRYAIMLEKIGITKEIPQPQRAAQPYRPARTDELPAAAPQAQETPQSPIFEQPEAGLEYTDDRREWANMDRSTFGKMMFAARPGIRAAEITHLWNAARDEFLLRR